MRADLGRNISAYSKTANNGIYFSEIERDVVDCVNSVKYTQISVRV